MAASDSHPRSDSPVPGPFEYLTAAALLGRIDEEIQRAERHGTQLSCLAVAIEDIEDLSPVQARELREQTLAYVSGALVRELRRFDRIGRPSERELLIVLPGADGPSGEVVARRVLARLRTIKIEVQGVRRALSVAVGLAAWREDTGAEEMLRRTRSAAHLGNGEDLGSGAPGGGGLLQKPLAAPALHAPQ